MEPIVEQIYQVHFLNKNDQPDTGVDIVHSRLNGEQYYVWTINTHDGLLIEYDQNGSITKWIKPRA